MHVGGYHEYRGGVQYHGGIFCYLNTPTVLIISIYMYHDIPPWYSNCKGWLVSPHGTEHSHGTQDIPHSTHDIPHMHHDIPHGTEHTLYRVFTLKVT